MSFELYDKEAERVVLGTLVYDSQLFAELSEILRDIFFYLASHQKIYQAIAEENEKNNDIDLTLVIANLREKDFLESIGGGEALVEIASLNSPVSAFFYAKKIRDLYLRRILQEKIAKVQESVLNKDLEIQEILHNTEKIITDITSYVKIGDLLHIKDLREDFIEYLKLLQERASGVIGVGTGFTKFDEITSGFKPGQLIILAARPGVGKSALALNILQDIAIHQGSCVLLFSLEMTRIELLIRLLCSTTYTDATALQRGELSQGDVDKMVAQMELFAKKDIYIDDSSYVSIHDFKFKSRQLHNRLSNQNKKIGLIIVDYLQLMHDSGGFREGRQREVANISREMKLIAKELNVPILALSQMNRSIEQRGKSPRPQLSDLRESGAIEQDADMVVFIHRDDTNPDLPPEEKNMTELIIAKNRSGPTGSCHLFFMKNRNLFTSVTNDQPSYDEQPPIEDISSII